MEIIAWSRTRKELESFVYRRVKDKALAEDIPSDSESARIFARQFVNKLFQNEKFLEDFQKVKEEWALKAKENLK